MDSNGTHEPRTLSDAAFLRIKSDIVSGALRPGAKLKVPDLVERYGVGASPLREALARLSAEHLVTLEGQRGFTVAPISRTEFEDLTTVRRLIEGEAVSRSVRLGGVDWETRIVAAFFRLQRAQQACLDNDYAWSEEWERSNREFHEAAVSESGSLWLLRLRRSFYSQCERYRRIAFAQPRVPRSAEADHKAIMDACLARNVALARRLSEEHIAKTAERVMPLLPQAEPARQPSRAALLLSGGNILGEAFTRAPRKQGPGAARRADLGRLKAAPRKSGKRRPA